MDKTNWDEKRNALLKGHSWDVKEIIKKVEERVEEKVKFELKKKK